MSKTADAPRPDVILDIVFEDGPFYVAIENIGEKPESAVHKIPGRTRDSNVVLNVLELAIERLEIE